MCVINFCLLLPIVLNEPSPSSQILSLPYHLSVWPVVVNHLVFPCLPSISCNIVTFRFNPSRNLSISVFNAFWSVWNHINAIQRMHLIYLPLTFSSTCENLAVGMCYQSRPMTSSQLHWRGITERSSMYGIYTRWCLELSYCLPILITFSIQLCYLLPNNIKHL